jgi:hypothetical protein
VDADVQEALWAKARKREEAFRVRFDPLGRHGKELMVVPGGLDGVADGVFYRVEVETMARQGILAVGMIVLHGDERLRIDSKGRLVGIDS